MEEKLDLSDIKCRQYYQLVQEKLLSPECPELNIKPIFTTDKGDGDVEDLGLSFKKLSEIFKIKKYLTVIRVWK